MNKNSVHITADRKSRELTWNEFSTLKADESID